MGLGDLQFLRLGGDGDTGLKGFADEFFLPRLFQFDQRGLTMNEEVLPYGLFFIS